MTIESTPGRSRGFGDFFSRSAAAASVAFRPGGVIVGSPQPDQTLTIMVRNGTHPGSVAGGAFGVVEDGKLRIEPALKEIPLFALLDGVAITTALSDSEQSDRDVFAAMGGRPESVTVDVPGHLVAAFKATILSEARRGWGSMYASMGAGIQATNPMVRAMLANDEANTKNVVDKLLEQLGQRAFTVKKAESMTVQKEAVEDSGYGIDEFDDDDDVPASSGGYRWNVVAAVRAGEGAELPLGAPVVSAVEGLMDPGAGQASVQTISEAQRGGDIGDIMSFEVVHTTPVMATNAAIAVEVHALIERTVPGMLRASATHYENITPPAPAHRQAEGEGGEQPSDAERDRPH